MTRATARPVGLSPEDRERLRRIVCTGTHPAQQVRRTRILLELDANAPGRVGPVPIRQTIAGRAGVHPDTVRQVAKAYADRGGDVAAPIRRKKRLTPPIVTREVEARIIALACSQPPEGYTRWSLQLLEKHIALVDDIPDLEHSTIGRVLKRGGPAPAPEKAVDHPHPRQRGVRRLYGRCPRRHTPARLIRPARWCAWKKSPINSTVTSATRSRPHPDEISPLIPSMSGQQGVDLVGPDHRGMFVEHQRIAVDWGPYAHTQLPDDPVTIARQQQWGRVGLAKVIDLINQQQPDVDRPPMTLVSTPPPRTLWASAAVG